MSEIPEETMRRRIATAVKFHYQWRHRIFLSDQEAFSRALGLTDDQLAVIRNLGPKAIAYLRTLTPALMATDADIEYLLY
jgi:hypothetical protein